MFPSAWVESSVEVCFRFPGATPTDQQDEYTRYLLWCLLPGRARRCAVVIAISRQTFITTLLKQSRFFRTQLMSLLTLSINCLRTRTDKGTAGTKAGMEAS